MNKCDMLEVKRLAVLQFVELVEAGAPMKWRSDDYSSAFDMYIGKFEVYYKLHSRARGSLYIDDMQVGRGGDNEQLASAINKLVARKNAAEAEAAAASEQERCNRMLKALNNTPSRWERWKRAFISSFTFGE